MNIIKYKPRTRSLFNWDFDNFLDNFFDDSYWTVGTSFPKVDVTEDKDNYLVEADIPGKTEKDIGVKVEGDIITISSKKTEEKEEKKNGYLIRERQHTGFCRSFTLPDDINREKIKAQFTNGVLKITLPKTAEKKAKTKSIEIKAE